MIEPTPTQRELFEAALALAPEQRAAYLAAHCTDPAQRMAIERMLEADIAEDARVLDESLDDLLERVGDFIDEAPPPGTRIGPFRLLDKLGEGGVTDAGVPYIALELIDGEPITDHARNRHLGLRQRLGLFVNVCRAVEAAHRALIVHRDLKPSNVLVTREGEVKLLDFGIAKLLDADAGSDGTRTQHQAITPAYAAPEQFNHGQITTATDVYALGVVVHALTGGDRSAQIQDRLRAESTSFSRSPAAAR